jgi:hypothetical protein
MRAALAVGGLDRAGRAHLLHSPPTGGQTMSGGGTILVPAILAVPGDETPEEVEQALRDFLSEQQWEAMSLTVVEG